MGFVKSERGDISIENILNGSFRLYDWDEVKELKEGGKLSPNDYRVIGLIMRKNSKDKLPMRSEMIKELKSKFHSLQHKMKCQTYPPATLIKILKPLQRRGIVYYPKIMDLIHYYEGKLPESIVRAISLFKGCLSPRIKYESFLNSKNTVIHIALVDYDGPVYGGIFNQAH